MKLKIVGFFLFLVLSANAQNFNKYFLNSTMRIDYFHIGDSEEEIITLDQIYVYGSWAGSLKNLIDGFNNGRYYAKIYDKNSGELIFSKGFDSYFGEYKTGSDAAEGIKRTYHESVLIPLPKEEVIFALERRDRENKLNEFYRTSIDPGSVSIIRDDIVDENVRVIKSLDHEYPHMNVDVVILGEGYTKEESEKFEKDLKKFTEVFFSIEPYASNKERFNLYGVYKPSEQSGTDEPRANIFKNTTLNSTFNSLGSERYLLTEDNKAMRDLAAHVPYDAIYIMVNHSRYGGGGIYNLFCTFTADNQWYEYLFLHEFGHSFGGLADEYYTSDVAYNDFYPKGIEPVEPNITALLDPPNAKWEVSDGIEIPTKWEKEEFDRMDNKWQAERRELNETIAKLKREKAPKEKIDKAVAEYDAKDRAHSKKIDQYLRSSSFYGKTGAFEGAGYSAKGLYRPMVDCIMFSKGNKPFCTVCEKRLQEVIDFYSE